MTKEELFEQAIDYFKQNDQEFIWAIEGLDSNHGYLDDARIEDMDDLNEWFYDDTVKHIMELAISGSDDNGGPFDPDKTYFYRNSWTGELVSTDTKDYSWFLDKEFISCLFREYVSYLDRGWAIDTYDYPEPIQELFDEYIAEHGRELSE